MIKYISLFSGIGAPEKALEKLNIPYELLGFSEIDKFAIKSYCKVHNVDESLNLGDITKIDINTLPTDIDLITHGSPCQDFSVAGKGLGGDKGSNTRSSLMWNTVDIVKHCKPKYILWENVKNVLSKKHRHNFDKYLNEMERLGYKNYYQVLNSKDYGVPQNRERVFVISIREDINKDFIFPEPFDNGIKLRDLLESEVDEKYYIDTEKASKLISEYKGDLAIGHPIRSREFEGTGWKEESPTLCARDYKDPKNVILPCTTPDRLNKRQNGRRFKENGDPMFTLTSQDRHGILVGNFRYDEGLRIRKNGKSPCLTCKVGGTSLSGNPLIITSEEQKMFKVREATKKGYAVAVEGDSINLEQPSSKTRRGRVGKQVSNTLNTSDHMAVVVKARDKMDYRIRKLTPRECWRLMGFEDKDFNKASEVNSNTQLYKQAGNSIVVNVLVEIFKQLFKEMN